MKHTQIQEVRVLPVDKERTALGQFLVSERHKRGWNQARLSVEANVGIATVVRLETGATTLRDVQVGTLQDIAFALGIQTSELLAQVERIQREEQ